MGVFSVSLSAKLVARFGIRECLGSGLLVAAMGLWFFSRAPTSGTFVVNVLPGMLLFGLGTGIASTPLLLCTMMNVHTSESGLASGIVNTGFIIGGALGLAVLATMSAARTAELLQSGIEGLAAINGGYRLAFSFAALMALTAAALAALLLRRNDGQRCSVGSAEATADG